MPSAAAVRREVRADFDIMDDDDEDALPFGIEEGREGEGGEEEEEAPRINVDIPRCVAQLGSELYFVKLPNFLSVETRYVQGFMGEGGKEEGKGYCRNRGIQSLKLANQSKLMAALVHSVQSTLESSYVA